MLSNSTVNLSKKLINKYINNKGIIAMFTISYVQELSIRLLEIFFSRINVSFTLKVRSSIVKKGIRAKKKASKLRKVLFKRKPNKRPKTKSGRLKLKHENRSALFFKSALSLKSSNLKSNLGELRFSKPLRTLLKSKKSLLKLRNLTKIKKHKLRRIKNVLKIKYSVNKSFLKKKKFKILTKFSFTKSKPNSINFSWVNRVYRLWGVSRRSYNSITQAVKSQSGFRSLRYLYKKGLKRCLKMLRQRSLKRTRFKSFYQKYLLYKNNPLRLKFARSYVKFKKTRSFIKPRKAIKTILRKSRRRIINRKPRVNLFRRKKFKRRLRRSRRLKNSLIRKKVYAATKDSRRLYRVVLGIRSKGKNRLIKSVKSLDHKTFYSKMLHFEMTLISLFLKTTFVKSLNDAIFLIKAGFVFVNGRLITNPMCTIKDNFIVQMPASKLLFKWLRLKNSGIFKIRKKINRLRWYKRRVKSSRFKKKSRRYPKWLYKYSMSGAKIPISCELDLSTLSMISLYQPYKLNEFSNNFWRFININSHNVYLWRLLN